MNKTEEQKINTIKNLDYSIKFINNLHTKYEDMKIKYTKMCTDFKELQSLCDDYRRSVVLLQGINRVLRAEKQELQKKLDKKLLVKK